MMDRKRPPKLSITHKFCAHGEPKLDIGQSRKSAPHNSITGRFVFGTGQIAAEPLF